MSPSTAGDFVVRTIRNIQPAGTLRVLALGPSSTMGFGNLDDETYPFLLEELLNEQFEGAACGRYSQAEVINLGIPHLDSSQLAELFIAEGKWRARRD